MVTRKGKMREEGTTSRAWKMTKTRKSFWVEEQHVQRPCGGRGGRYHSSAHSAPLLAAPFVLRSQEGSQTNQRC